MNMTQYKRIMLLLVRQFGLSKSRNATYTNVMGKAVGRKIDRQLTQGSCSNDTYEFIKTEDSAPS